jgi:hypothetical protein
MPHGFAVITFDNGAAGALKPWIEDILDRGHLAEAVLLGVKALEI